MTISIYVWFINFDFELSLIIRIIRTGNKITKLIQPTISNTCTNIRLACLKLILGPEIKNIKIV